MFLELSYVDCVDVSDESEGEIVDEEDGEVTAVLPKLEPVFRVVDNWFRLLAAEHVTVNHCYTSLVAEIQGGRLKF
jgi:hypothetical protein